MKEDSVHLILVVLVVAVLVVQVISIIQVSSLVSSGTVTKHTNSTSQLGYITISATGSGSAQPTTGTLYLSVQGKGSTAAAATANLSSALTQMNQSLWNYINHNASLMQTTYYNLYNNSNNVICPGGIYPCTTVGNTTNLTFVASEQITVIIPNINNVSKALGALSSINSVQVSSASATLSDAQVNALRSVAFSNALQNATSQASILTRNSTLSTQNITVNNYYFYPVPYALGAASSQAGPGNPTPNPAFYSGKDSISESITIVFSYNKK